MDFFKVIILSLSLAVFSSNPAFAQASTEGRHAVSKSGEHPAQTDTSDKPAFEHFIRRDGNRLFDGDREFRFLSVNVPTLNYVEDEMAFEVTNPYGLPNEFELRDLFKTVNILGGKVVRSYTIPVRNLNFPPEAVTYVEAPGVFNEDAFKAMDLAVALAGEHQVRLIVPLVNNWEWFGGRPNYAAFRGKDKDAFCTDRQIIADFKQTIAHVVNRRNTITGVVYKDDPTIMAWETGNEMTCPPSWAVEIARYLKELDPKHLVVDGWHAVHMPNLNNFVQPHSINDPAIDLVSTHHYEEDAVAMLANIRKTVEIVGDKKPILVGEFGFVSTTGMERIMDYIIDEPSIAGGLIWSLRRHHRNGGWYQHTEPGGGGIFRAYHWPGFDDGVPYDERGLLALLRERAHRIDGQAAPVLDVPDPPRLLPIAKVGAINWQGSVGGEDYVIERADGLDGPFERIAGGIDDMETPGFDLFSDENAIPGRSYYYRVRARNIAGESPPSNIVGPVTANVLTRVDRARNFGTAVIAKDIAIKSGDYRSYKEAYSRLSGQQGSHLIYSAPGSLTEIRVFTYESGERENLRFSISNDGTDWIDAEAAIESYPNAETNYEYLTPREYRLNAAELAGGTYVKISFVGASEIVRVEIDYAR